MRHLALIVLVFAAACSSSNKGGYYKDDGPGSRAPGNLSSIPDARPRVEPLHKFANRPYEVFGKKYVPLASVRPFRQRGVASWYGKRFHGQKTASGEIYDMYAMSAAHPILPIPSYVRVTSVKNGAQVIVRINDRGPFHGGRVIDLSYAAASRLGLVGAGSGEVEIQSIVPGSL
jgi:rare lipoprotein A